jgi:hypothetical protein
MKSIAVSTVCLLLVGGRLSAVSIDTVASWDGSSFISSFGIPNTQTYGQTVTVPVGLPVLQSFSFEMELPPPLAFRGEVYAWDGTKAAGPNLFESDVTSTTTGGNVFQLITFDTGGIALVPGGVYVLFASTSKDNSNHSGRGIWGVTQFDDTYAGGTTVYINNGTDTTKWTSKPWATLPGDLAFQATFASGSGVTEPPTTPLFASGLIAFAIATQRRRLFRAPHHWLRQR